MKRLIIAVVLVVSIVSLVGERLPVPHLVYLPLVSSPSVTAVSGYAWTCLSETDTAVLEMTWFHRWQPEASRFRCNGPEFVQHFSCETRPYTPPYWQDQYAELEKHVQVIGDKPFPLLFLNEPDLSGQCQRTPAEAVVIYEKVIAIAPTAVIVGPQVSHLDYSQGWPWLTEWFELVVEAGLPLPEYGAIHNYDQEPVVQLDSYSQVPHAPERVWVTEFGTSNPILLYQMLHIYSTDERVERYAYFSPVYDVGGFVDIALSIDDELTELGEVWVTFHSKQKGITDDTD